MERDILDKPFSIDIPLPGGILPNYDEHLVRRLSSMKGQYRDESAYKEMLAEHDVILYEVYEIRRPEKPGELLSGTSILHPGKVGDEFFMTKGHFHAVLETAEIYYCLQGIGLMVMETPEGDCCVETLTKGRVLYVPPRWAHRSVNTSNEQDLVTFFIYPGHAGHDYGTIETRGFLKRVIERSGRVEVIDNLQWRDGR